MGGEILGWADLAMHTAEVVALIAALLLFLRLHRNIAAMLRVIRRIDRKMADATTSLYRRRPAPNGGPLNLAGNLPLDPQGRPLIDIDGAPPS